MPAWPFWAATEDGRIDAALDLAGLRPGESLVDLGCGDGRVMVRAARRHGAAVAGVELDAELGATARQRLADAGAAGTVTTGDLLEAPLDADVVYAYLSPATLQRLRPRLAALTAPSRVVTTGYPVPGWAPSATAEGCWLYVPPATTVVIDRSLRGWDSAGVLVSLRPGVRTLVAAKLHHPGGPVEVGVTDGLEGLATARAGADTAEEGDEVVVDLRFGPLDCGVLVAGTLEATGAGPLRVFAAADPGRPGIWGLSSQGCREAAEVMASGDFGALVAGARALPGPPSR